MSLEAATYISQLNVSNPTAADTRKQGDDHLRLIKSVLKNQFPNFGATAVTPTAAELNHVDGVTSPIQTQLNTLDTTKLDASAITSYARLDATQVFTKSQRIASKEISVLAGQILRVSTFSDWDAALTDNWRIIVNGNFTIENPANIQPGHSLVIVLDQVGGPWNITFSATSGPWRFPFGVAPDLTQVSGTIDMITAHRVLNISGLNCVFSPDFSAV